jgi:hypothetical protein
MPKESDFRRAEIRLCLAIRADGQAFAFARITPSAVKKNILVLVLFLTGN